MGHLQEQVCPSQLANERRRRVSQVRIIHLLHQTVILKVKVRQLSSLFYLRYENALFWEYATYHRQHRFTYIFIYNKCLVSLHPLSCNTAAHLHISSQQQPRISNANLTLLTFCLFLLAVKFLPCVGYFEYADLSCTPLVSPNLLQTGLA